MTIITKESIGQSYENIKLFNDIAENLEGNFPELVDNQLGYIFEELTETIDAFEQEDATNLIKEAVDLWVTVAGLLQKLEAAGFDVEETMRLVDQNNLDKFPQKGEPLQYGAGQTATFNAKYGRYVIKDSSGKVRKPATYKAVDTSDCAPENFFKQE